MENVWPKQYPRVRSHGVWETLHVDMLKNVLLRDVNAETYDSQSLANESLTCPVLVRFEDDGLSPVHLFCGGLVYPDVLYVLGTLTDVSRLAIVNQVESYYRGTTKSTRVLTDELYSELRFLIMSAGGRFMNATSLSEGAKIGDELFNSILQILNLAENKGV